MIEETRAEWEAQAGARAADERNRRAREGTPEPEEDWREAARRRAEENRPADAAAVAAALALADPAPFPTLEGDPGVLTPDEHEAMRLTTDLANLLGRIVGPSTTRQSDLAEVIVPLHVIQRYVMAQAAARAYPAQYRALGGWFQ